jgi:hypothetical protein
MFFKKILNNKLQKNLEKKEKRNKSNNFDYNKPTIVDKIKLISKYYGKNVEKIPQKRSIYSSLDEQLNDYIKELNFEDLPKEVNYWIGVALKNAREGYNKVLGYKVSLTIAREYMEEKLPDKLVNLVEDMYKSAIPYQANKHVKEWLDIAYEDALIGDDSDTGYKTAINIAKRYANEGNIIIPEQKIKNIEITFLKK